jgi:hypothetical protein
MRKARTLLAIALLVVGAASCKAKGVAEAEASADVTWLAQSGTPEAVAALGRLADTDARAIAALQSRSSDLNTYIAAWTAVTRNAAWGVPFLRVALADPVRADMAATALPRRDPRLAALVPDLEAALVRLASSQRASLVAGVLASVGPQAHATVERRLIDPKTRGAMCNGIGLPEASGDAKSTLLAVPPEGRDDAACVDDVVTMAKTEDAVLGWLAAGAEPGLLGALAKSSLPCPRVAIVWQKALTERPPETHAALAVPLSASIQRCTAALDPVLADLLEKAPGSRAVITQAVQPGAGNLADMKLTCTAFGRPFMRAESARVRERAADALAQGCRFAK